MAEIFEKMFKDPLYDYIFIDNNICDDIIDSPYFQRLRRIEQTSMRCLYPSARHDRFIHSIGVYHLAKTAIAALRKNETVYIDMKKEESKFHFPDESTRESIYFSLEMAALLHDICHSPFSHTLECYFSKAFNEEGKEEDHYALLKEFYKSAEAVNSVTSEESDFESFKIQCKDANAANHEIASCIFIFEYFRDTICKIAKDRNSQKVESDEEGANKVVVKPLFLFMARCILGAIYNKERTHEEAYKNCIIKILNSSIDVDKLDYITRDSSVSGFANTLVDTKRLLGSLVLAVYKSSSETEQICLAFQKTAVGVIQNVVNSRNALYTWIYSHHKVVYESELIEKAIAKIAMKQPDKQAFYKQYFSPSSIKENFVCDDTIWSLLLQHKDIPEIKELISRNKRKKAIWKSFAEFQGYFNTGSKLTQIGQFSKQQMDAYFTDKDKIRNNNAMIDFINYLNQFAPNGEKPFQFAAKLNNPKVAYIQPNTIIVYLNNKLFSFDSIFSDLYKKGDIPPFFYLYCSKEDKERLRKNDYKLRKELIEYIKSFEGFRERHK